MNDDDFVSLLNEQCSSCGGDGDGIEMLMQNLAKIHEYSGELMGLVGREPDLEDWIEDKLSKAAQSLSDVKHYIEYRKSAYGMHMGAIEMHGGDVSMDQRAGVSGRMPGERMPVMSQNPVMTPQSSMSGAEGGCGVSDGIQDTEDDMMMMMVGGEEIEDEPMGPDVEGMHELPGDETGPVVEPVEDEEHEEEEEDEDDMSMVSLSEIWIGSKKKI